MFGSACMILNLVKKHRNLFWYGVALATLLVVLQLLEYHFLIVNYAMNIYISCIAIVFTTVGIWLALKLSRPKVQTVVIEKNVAVDVDLHFAANQLEIERLNLSKRELDVLNLMAGGLSNQEIAEKLYVSLNTIKTHSSRIFEKMEVKRRTQAIEMARRLGIIPKA